MVGRVSSLIINENLEAGIRASHTFIYTTDSLRLLHYFKINFMMTKETTGILKQHFDWVVEMNLNRI